MARITKAKAVEVLLEEDKVYSFNELSDEAKEHAIEKYRDHDHLDYDWWEFTYDEWGEKLEKEYGIDVMKSVKTKVWDKKTKKWIDGYKQEAQITFQLYCQGAGAEFDIQRVSDDDKLLEVLGYGHIKAMLKLMGREDIELSFNADLYIEVNEDYTIETETMDFIDPEQIEQDAKDLKEKLEREIYKELDKEYDYLNSDEAISETILANDYEFDEEGDRI